MTVRPPNFGRTGAGRESGIQAVDVEAQVDRTAADLLPDLGHQRSERLVPALLGLDDAKALLARPVEVVGGIAGAAQPDLDHAAGVQELLLDRAAERRPVCDRLTEHRLVDVGMSVDVDQADRSMALTDGAQDRQRQSVIAPERQRPAALRKDSVVGSFDDRDRLLEVIGVGRHVADVGDLEVFERRRPGRHVVGAEQRGLGADLARAEAGPAAVRGPDVERHADEAGVQALRRGLRGQAHHRARPAEARHLVAAEWLVEGSGHAVPSDRAGAFAVPASAA